MVVTCVGAVPTSRGAPTIRPARSWRMRPASLTAPSTFNSPAPCSSVLNPGSLWAVYSSTALTRFGVRFGFLSSIRAAAPATNGHTNNYSIIESLSHRFAQRVVLIGIDRRRAKAQVHHSDVVNSFVGYAPVYACHGGRG